MEQPFRFAVLVKNVLTAQVWRKRAEQIEESVMLAKETATVDVLSGGRIDLALGTGWVPQDYQMLGIDRDSPADRVSRLEESVRLIKRLWTETDVDHDGTYYTTRGATVVPRVVQDRHPPILIGGLRKRMLTLAAREADIVSTAGLVTATEMERIVATIRDAAGARFDRLQLHSSCDVAVVDDPEPLYEKAAKTHDCSVGDVRESPSYLYGSLESLQEKLLACRERFGVTYYAISQDLMGEFAPLARRLTEAS